MALRRHCAVVAGAHCDSVIVQVARDVFVCRNKMSKQGSSRIELFPVHPEGVTVWRDPGLEIHYVLGARLRECISESLTIKDLFKIEFLLVFSSIQPNCIDHAEMVVRELTERRIRSGKNGENLD